MERKIDFFLVGAPKAGSTSLDYYLGQHPDIFLPSSKDLWAFMDAGIQTVREEDLPIYYKNYCNEKLIGLSQVRLLFFPESPQLLFNYNPDAKLIAILRNPIDRAYSAYWHLRRVASEDCPTFEEALQLEKVRCEGDYRMREAFSYLSHGCYYEQILRLRSVFPESQIYISLTDDLKQNSKKLTADIIHWLGLDPNKGNIDFTANLNMSMQPKSMKLQRLLLTPYPVVRKAYYSIVPPFLRHFLQQRVVQPIVSRNEVPFKYPPMHLETRERLREYFAPHNDKLSHLIGRDLSQWQ